MLMDTSWIDLRLSLLSWTHLLLHLLSPSDSRDLHTWSWNKLKCTIHMHSGVKYRHAPANGFGEFCLSLIPIYVYLVPSISGFIQCTGSTIQELQYWCRLTRYK
jgi:hypothetical protein